MTVVADRRRPARCRPPPRTRCGSSGPSSTRCFIRGFFDANDDGVGDIPGLIAKLDYLQWLGVDCLWLLPFYPSPLRDGGYDISDYFNVHPESGTVDDSGALLTRPTPAASGSSPTWS